MNTNTTQALQAMLAGVVDYKVAQGPCLPPITAAVHEYLWAGNGIFIRAKTKFWEAQIQTVAFETCGLLPAKSYFKWLDKKILGGYLGSLYTHAQDACGENLSTPIEVLYRFQWKGDWKGHVLTVPEQEGSYGLVSTTDVGDENTTVEIHSHHVMRAEWSPTDDNDHKGTRIYGLIGDFGKEAPMMRLRVSINGDRKSVV